MTAATSSSDSDSVMRGFWSKLTRRAARENRFENRRNIQALVDEAHVKVLQKTNDPEDAPEYDVIDKAARGAYGDREYALRNLVLHLPNHDAENIVDAIGEARIAGRPEPELLTHDHIIVCDRLTHWFDPWDYESDFDQGPYKAGPNSTAMDEFKKTVAYAMTHIEDGHLIVSALYDRGIGTLDGILDILPELRATNHSTLTDGIL